MDDDAPGEEPPSGAAPSPREPRWRSGTVADWFFRSRVDDRITIAQLPNPPLWVFIGTVALRFVLAPGTTARSVVEWVGAAALLWWSVDEVARGVNPWRRLLGAVVLAFTVVGIVDLAR